MFLLHLIIGKFPIITSKNDESFKDHLVCSILSITDKKGGSCKCHWNRFQICNLTEETATFSHRTTDEAFKIKKVKVYSPSFVYTRNGKLDLREHLNEYKNLHHCKCRKAFVNNKRTNALQQ